MIDISPDELEAFEERAAMLEYDAGYPRPEAEKIALEEIKQRNKEK